MCLEFGKELNVGGIWEGELGLDVDGAGGMQTVLVMQLTVFSVSKQAIDSRLS